MVSQFIYMVYLGVNIVTEVKYETTDQINSDHDIYILDVLNNLEHLWRQTTDVLCKEKPRNCTFNFKVN